MNFFNPKPYSYRDWDDEVGLINVILAVTNLVFLTIKYYFITSYYIPSENEISSFLQQKTIISIIMNCSIQFLHIGYLREYHIICIKNTVAKNIYE